MTTGAPTQAEAKQVNSCPYCGAKVELKSSSIIYSEDYGLVYICSQFPSCDAYVGVHKNTKRAKGTVANKELRLLRGQCHTNFDMFWKAKGWGRSKAYKWLAAAMGLSRTEAHIAMFGEGNCNMLLSILRRNDE